MNASAETKARWLFAGFVLLVALGVAGWLLLDTVRYRTYELRTHDAVSGLIAGAPVEFHGVEVGKVRSVELLQPRLVRVLVEVGRDVPVSSATIATITGRGLATRGFTGYVYVSLEDSGSAVQPLARDPESAYPLLASAPSRSVSLDTSVSALNDTVQSVNGLLQAALDPPTVAALKQSLASLEKVTRTLSANNDRLSTILVNAEHASQQVQPLLQSSNEAARTLQTQLLPRMQDSLVRIDRLAAGTEQASMRIEPLLLSSQETVRVLQTQLLPEAQRTLSRLDQLSTSLGDTAGRVRRNPALLVRGGAPNPPGPGEGP